MKIDKINLNGKKDSIEVLDKVFLGKINKKLVYRVLYKTNANYKGRHGKTKQQNEIRGSTSKIYAQKGTGNARHASRKAPIFVGGGVAHGPKGSVYKIKKINKKIRKLGLFHLLSQKNKVNSLFVVDDFKEEIIKTKFFYQFLEKFKLNNSLIISDKSSTEKIIKSVRNIPDLKIIDQVGTNAYDLLKYKNVIFTTTSLKNFQERIVKWKNLII